MSAARLFRSTLAALLISIANAHGAARAEQLAQVVPRDELAPEIDPAALPPRGDDGKRRTSDGRVIPENVGFQLENVLHKLEARGELPAHPDISLDKLKQVGRVLADLDDEGTGCHMSLSTLEHDRDLGQSQFRAVCAWLEQHGFALNFGRVRAEDRMFGGARRPLTGAKSTVRKVFPIPRWLAAKLSDEEVLDLIAAGDARPVARLVYEAPSPAPPPRSTPRPPPPSMRPEAGLVAAPLAELAQLTSQKVDASWVREQAAALRLADHHVVDALTELVTAVRTEQAGVTAMGKQPRRWGAEQACGRVARFLEGKASWLAKGGEQAMLGAEAREREQLHRKHKSAEQLEREDPENRAALSRERSAGRSRNHSQIVALQTRILNLTLARTDHPDVPALQAQLDELQRGRTGPPG